MAGHEHDYNAHLIWDDHTGQGTATYDGYSRRYRIVIPGKPDLAGSADTAFRGEADRHNPEDLLVAALSSCHMLTYLALCARRRIRVLAYEDEASGRMVTDDSGGGRFEEVTLRPRVTISGEAKLDDALALHDAAHKYCFIAASVNFPIRHEAVVTARAAGAG